MKKLFLIFALCSLLFALSVPVFAQTPEEVRTYNAADCSFPFVLRGDTDVRTETTRDYIVSPEDSALDIEKKVTYTLQQ